MERRFEAVFGYGGPARSGYGGGQGGGQRGGKGASGGRFGGRGRGARGTRWDGQPELPARQRRPDELLRPERPEQLLLATLINHNSLLTEFVEDLVGIDFVSAELNALRRRSEERRVGKECVSR